MVSIELGLADQINLIETPVVPGKPNIAYAGKVNPLGKIPALQTDEGTTIVDSSVICEYLDCLDGESRLFPAAGPRRWQVLTEHSLANGMMEASVLLRYETFSRPEKYRWPDWIDAQWEKVNTGLSWFNEKSEPNADKPDIAQITLACALGYLDFRSEEYNWRKQFSKLAEWHKQVSQRTSYSTTRPDA